MTPEQAMAAVERRNRLARERYHSDAAYRERVISATSERVKRRYHSDPEFRERVKAAARASYHRRKAEA